MVVQTKRDVIKLLQINQDKLKAFGVISLGIFGSFVNNIVNKESDIDLLVELKSSHKTFDNFMNLLFFLEDILGRKVDLVTIESLSPYIGKNILEEVEYV